MEIKINELSAASFSVIETIEIIKQMQSRPSNNTIPRTADSSSPECGGLTLGLAGNLSCVLHDIGGVTLVDDEAEAANLVLLAQIGAVLAVLIEPLGWHYNLEHGLHDRHLELTISFSCGRK